MYQRFIYLLLSLVPVFAAFGQAASSTDTIPKPWSRPSVGLVLSGGGAKGIAHVGVIKALEENDIPIDYVTGTSMGAIVGSLYCCGWSPDRMIDFFTTPGFHDWSTGTINPSDKYYFSLPSKNPEWASINLSLRDSTILKPGAIPANLISPIPMNFEFMRLYSPYTKQCGADFNNLFVPFRCVTSDIYNKHKIVCKEGSLGNSVRASMSFPLVFKPITLNGMLVYDGGIYDNFPVDVMHADFDPDFIIGVSVSSPDGKPEPGNAYSQLEDMIIQNNNYDVPAGEGVKIQVPVLQFGVLDFGKAKEIYDIGYKTGLAMVDSIKKRTSARATLREVTARRDSFAARTPVITFDSVEVKGTTRQQSRYLTFLFNHGRNMPFGMASARSSYYRAVTDGKLYDLLPQAEFKGDSTVLLLDADVKPSWRVGVGGWVSSSTNSMLYLNLGYNTLRFNALDANLSGWIGQTYFAGMASAAFAMRTSVPSAMKISAVVSKQKFYGTELLFYENPSPSFISDFQSYIRAEFSWAIGRKAKGFADLGYAYMWDKYYGLHVHDYSKAKRDVSKYRVAMFRAGLEGSTLNYVNYPSSGWYFKAMLSAAYEEHKYQPGEGYGMRDYTGYPVGHISAEWKHYYNLSKVFTLGAAAWGMATFQHHQENYTAALISAPAFEPTPSTSNYFNPAFRSPNYLAAGVIPMWTPFTNFQLRGDFYLFAPVRNPIMKADGILGYKGWFRKSEFIGELAAVYNFPFASLSVYVNYLSYPARNWNFGINFGIFLPAPRFER